MNRRAFFKTAAGAAALTAASERLFHAAQTYGEKRVPIALQLYTVGANLRQDMAGTLAQIAKLGYKGVEFAGFNNVAAAGIKKMLNDNVVLGVSSHRQR